MLWTLMAGLLLGWIVSGVVGTNRETGPLAYLIAGFVGAWSGGLLPVLMAHEASFGINFHLGQFVLGLLGAGILIALYHALSGHRTIIH